MPVRPIQPFDVRPNVRPEVRPEVTPQIRPEAPIDPQTERQAFDRFRQQTRNYPNWNASQYDNSTKRAFNATPTTQQQYENELVKAAAEKKPVVLMIGRGSDPSCRQVIDNSARQAKSASANQGHFVFVDLDKVDPNSSIGKFGAAVERDKGAPYTMAFTQRPGENGAPTQADRPSLAVAGPLRSERIAEAISRGRLTMSERRFPNLYAPEVQPPSPTPPGPEIRPNPGPVRPNPGQDRPGQDRPNPGQDRPNPAPDRPPTQAELQARDAVKLMDEAVAKQADKRASYELFRQAMVKADASGDKMLASITRVELGLACNSWGFTDQAAAWLLDAGKNNPELYQHPSYAKRLQDAGLPRTAVDLLVSEGQRNSQWYMADKAASLDKVKTAMRR